MPSKPRATPQERHETDQSLHLERAKSDEEISKRYDDIERRSDAVLEKARGKADHVLENARDKADAALEREGATGTQMNALDKERADEDEALAQERDTAATELQAERLERKRALERLLGHERDATDMRLLIERARGDAALSARDDFMAMVNHDIRNLLGGIALSAEMLLRDARDDASGIATRKSAERIQRFTAAIKRLVGDLVDISSIEIGAFAVEPDSSDVVEVVTAAIDAFEAGAAAKGITVACDIADGVTAPRFDHDRILQVLANLLSNAIKFTPQGGTVSLRVERVDEEVWFSVRDTGPGIAADHLKPIFDRFWQVKKDDARGLGLGLFISRCIVEAHGGRIWAESAPAGGTTVRFALPAAS